MSLVADVQETLRCARDVEDSIAMDEALREAVRLADLFDEIKPEPYVVPIERFAGMPVPKSSGRKSGARLTGCRQDVEDEALREAVRLSDLFDEIKPEPYVVPIERFAGMPVPGSGGRKSCARLTGYRQDADRVNHVIG